MAHKGWVFGFWGHHNKVPQTKGLNPTECYSLTVLGASIGNQGVARAMFLVKALENHLFCDPLLAFGSLTCFLACR